MIIRNLYAGMQVASWWKAVENRAEMAQKWGILLRWYIQSKAETYLALANHTRPENPTLRFFPPVETGLAPSPLVGELDAPAETRQAASLQEGRFVGHNRCRFNGEERCRRG
jgi:hypothetical protein